jgi:hypothetical protein
MEAFEVIRKAFDLGKIDSLTFQKAYDVIEKSKGNLVAKKVFAKRKDGKVYMTTVWVNPNSGEQFKKPEAGYVEAPTGTPETIVGDSVKITKKDGAVLEGILSYIHAWTDKKTGLQNADFHVQDSEGKTKKVVIGKIQKFEKFVSSVEPEPEGEKDNNGYTILKTLGGSTGALLVQKNGIKFVKKTAADENHLANEVRSLKYFSQMGVQVPKVEQYIKGEAVYLEYIEGKELGKIDNSSEQYKKACSEISKKFIAHALMMNWDVIGMNLDNVMIKPDGTPVFIDVGGSMGYRAQGGIKKQWNDWDTGSPISELSAMLNPNLNQTCAEVMKTGFSYYFGIPFEKLESNNSLAKILKSQVDVIKANNPEWYLNPSNFSSKLKNRLDATENALDAFLNPSTDWGFTPPKLTDEELFKDIEKTPKEKSFEEKFEERLKEIEQWGTELRESYKRIKKLFENEINTCDQYGREDIKEFYEDLAKHMAITTEEADSFKIFKHSGYEKNDKEFLDTVKDLGITTNHLESIRTHTDSSGGMNPIFRGLVKGLEDGYNISFKNQNKVSFNKKEFFDRLKNPSENFNSCRLMIDLFSKISVSNSKFYRKNITLYRGIKLNVSTIETMGRNGNNIFSEAGVASNAQTYEKSWSGCKVVQSNVEGIDVHTVGTHPNELETITKPYNMLQVTSFHDTASYTSDTNINENGRMQIRVEKTGLIPLKF